MAKKTPLRGVDARFFQDEPAQAQEPAQPPAQVVAQDPAPAQVQEPAQAPAQDPALPAPGEEQRRFHFWGPATLKAWVAQAAAARRVPEAEIMRHVLEWYLTHDGPLLKAAPYTGPPRRR